MSNKKNWEKLAQPGELDFHQKNEWRQTSDFMRETKELFRLFGYNDKDFANEIVIDLGCGSKLRSKYFFKSKIVAIEPLADKFINTIDWSDLNDAYKVFSEPAEKMIKELKNSAAFIMCINVLDHTFDPVKVLNNCYSYMKEDGQFLLSVDIHGHANDLHPIELTPEKLEGMIKDANFKIVKKFDKLDNGRESYGHGKAYTYILKKYTKKSFLKKFLNKIGIVQ